MTFNNSVAGRFDSKEFGKMSNCVFINSCVLLKKFDRSDWSSYEPLQHHCSI